MGRIEKLTLYSLILLLIWGNMVMGYAGLACPDWPLCLEVFRIIFHIHGAWPSRSWTFCDHFFAF